MPVKLDDLHEAYVFVESSGFVEHLAFVHRPTGAIWFWSEDLGWLDEDGPEGIEDPGRLGEDYVPVPGRHELALGSRLVREFVDRRIPEEAGRVAAFFRRKGAYRRFKAFLEERGLLDDWHRFEEEAQKEALRAWAEREGIELLEE
ncbi:hypothetical protein [Deferrisoma sp.]